MGSSLLFNRILVTLSVYASCVGEGRASYFKRDSSIMFFFYDRLVSKAVDCESRVLSGVFKTQSCLPACLFHGLQFNKINTFIVFRSQPGLGFLWISGELIMWPTWARLSHLHPNRVFTLFSFYEAATCRRWSCWGLQMVWNNVQYAEELIIEK